MWLAVQQSKSGQLSQKRGTSLPRLHLVGHAGSALDPECSVNPVNDINDDIMPQKIARMQAPWRLISSRKILGILGMETVENHS